jgi:hypothetical protein
MRRQLPRRVTGMAARCNDAGGPDRRGPRLTVVAAACAIGAVVYLMSDLEAVRRAFTFVAAALLGPAGLPVGVSADGLALLGEAGRYETTKECLLLEALGVASPLLIRYRRLWVGAAVCVSLWAVLNAVRMAVNVALPEAGLAPFDATHATTYIAMLGLLIAGTFLAAGIRREPIVPPPPADKQAP